MNWDFEELRELFSTNNLGRLLLKGKWGLEKESLRINGDGSLAMTPHPSSLGDKSNNPFITTDFSESQFELITPAFDTIEGTYNFLVSLEEQVDEHLKDELIWPLSMPGQLPPDDRIPVARFDNSSRGHEKEIYRAGLALRYGKKMQMISGIHYNFSFSPELLGLLQEHYGSQSGTREFTDQLYFSLVRNFLRYRWLFIYLFGASPAIDEGYREEIERKIAKDKEFCKTDIEELFSNKQHATSVRMSRFGYENKTGSENHVSYNSLKEHTADIERLLSTKSLDFARLGIYREGKQIQLNDRLLQLENEYYSPVRFKQILQEGETQVRALRERGVEYLEIRTFDLNPFEKGGVDLNQLYFTQLFMLYCLFEKSPLMAKEEQEWAGKNAQISALCGRSEKSLLYRDNAQIPLKLWGEEILGKMEIIAQIIDNSQGASKYSQVLVKERQKLSDSSLLPSSRILNEMIENGENHRQFGLKRAKRNRAVLPEHKYCLFPPPCRALTF